MQISHLELFNFRNMEHLELHPENGLNVVVGMNGQGKSALMEAIYLLSTSKSHRTNKDVEMIRFEQELTRVSVAVSRQQRNDTTMEIMIPRSGGKVARVDKSQQTRISDMVGQLNAVIFSSSDIDMVKGEPSLRRRFLNLEIAQISPRYMYAFAGFRRVLEQRNNLLKSFEGRMGNPLELETWDEQLSSYGGVIMGRRQEFVNKLKISAARVYSALAGDRETLEVQYQPSCQLDSGVSEEDARYAFRAALKRRRDSDVRRGTTTIGPHRDDLVLRVNGIAAREYASQGQQRSTAIAIKLAEIDVIAESAGELPVILLDDVLAELDDKRRVGLLDMVGSGGQTFLTTTSAAELDKDWVSKATLFELCNGMLVG